MLGTDVEYAHKPTRSAHSDTLAIANNVKHGPGAVLRFIFIDSFNPPQTLLGKYSLSLLSSFHKLKTKVQKG